ncbi:MAG: hypothetical protein P3B76_10980 [Gemmatimonadota bacterium]|nr:hypothetical protein [Gemmatimonadota bacterium]
MMRDRRRLLRVCTAGRGVTRAMVIALAAGTLAASEALSVLLRPLPAQPAPVATGVLTPPSGSRVRAGFVVRPDTVEVGDPFTLIVTVVVPDGARIEWPTIDDTTAVVVMRAPTTVVQEAMRAGGRTERASYALAAWNVGALPIGLADAVVRYGSTTMRIPLADARVLVKSVLPGDTTLHTPKPARDLFQRVVPWWQQWWPALAVVSGLALLWWIWRRRRRRGAGGARESLDPYRRALHDFDRLDRLALVGAGERGRAVALAIDVLRGYLAARSPDATLSRTSVELVDATAGDDRVPHAQLRALLTDGDGVKFAGQQLSDARAHELTGAARAIVEHVEGAERARRAAEAAARAAAERAEREARQAHEDEARRASRRPKTGAT